MKDYEQIYVLEIPEFRTSTRSKFLTNLPPTLADDELGVKLQCLVIYKFKLSSDHFSEYTLVNITTFVQSLHYK